MQVQWDSKPAARGICLVYIPVSILKPLSIVGHRQLSLPHGLLLLLTYDVYQQTSLLLQGWQWFTTQCIHTRYAWPMIIRCLYFTATFLASHCLFYFHDALIIVTPDGLHILLCDLVNEPFNNINSLALFKRTWTEVFWNYYFRIDWNIVCQHYIRRGGEG